MTDINLLFLKKSWLFFDYRQNCWLSTYLDLEWFWSLGHYPWPLWTSDSWLSISTSHHSNCISLDDNLVLDLVLVSSLESCHLANPVLLSSAFPKRRSITKIFSNVRFFFNFCIHWAGAGVSFCCGLKENRVNYLAVFIINWLLNVKFSSVLLRRGHPSSCLIFRRYISSLLEIAAGDFIGY